MEGGNGAAGRSDAGFAFIFIASPSSCCMRSSREQTLSLSFSCLFSFYRGVRALTRAHAVRTAGTSPWFMSCVVG